MPLLRVIACLVLVSQLPLEATPELASKIQETWELAATQWKVDAQKAITPEQRDEILKNRPNAAAYASRMWGAIGKSLDQPWTIEPAAWFLQISNGITRPATIDDSPTPAGSPVPMFATEIDKTKKAILEHHVRSADPGLYRMCFALALLSDPLSLSILEKIETTNTDAKIQGVAALCAAMAIKNLGDDGELMRKRLSYLRKAIINSADVDIGETNVAKLAEIELYQIRYLSKGREAPEIAVADSSGKAFQLSQERGKVVILIFWNTIIPEAQHVIAFTNEMATKFANKPVLIMGINNDPGDKLRAMQADGTVTWRNLSDSENKLAKDYRIGTWPMVYVLDHKQRIQYAGALGSFVELTADALMAEIR